MLLYTYVYLYILFEYILPRMLKIFSRSKVEFAIKSEYNNWHDFPRHKSGEKNIRG